MGKKAGNSIEWATHTWNPVKGRCFNNCDYCYMHEFFRRFPRLDHAPELSQPELRWKAPKGAFVFVGSSLDLFHPSMPDRWIRRTIHAVAKQPHAVFAFLTKFPTRYYAFQFSPNVVLGTTFDGLQHTRENVDRLLLFEGHERPIFVSFEPLLAYPDDGIKLEGLDWIIIGADSRRGAEKAPDEWADRLMEQAREHNIPIFLKDNYKYNGQNGIPKERPAMGEYLCVTRTSIWP